MALQPLTPREIRLFLVACPNCGGSGQDPELVSGNEGIIDDPDTTCAQCNGLAVALDLPPQAEGLLLYLAASRWIYSKEPERLGVSFQRATELEGELAQLLEQHGYADLEKGPDAG